MIMRLHSELITRSIPGAQGKMIEGASHGGVFENPYEVMNPLLLGFYEQSAE